MCAKRRREPAERDRRLEKLAIEVLTALGERDATSIAATEQRASAALQAMITDESLTVSEAVQWCAGAIGHREAARLRQLAAEAQQRLARERRCGARAVRGGRPARDEPPSRTVAAHAGAMFWLSRKKLPGS